MTYKTIFKGRLEFGSPKSYDKVLKMYQHRVENYYKSDILLIEEEIFDEASSSLNVPRLIIQGSEKSWKNTISLLEYVAQFAVAGNMGAWMTENGKILRHGIIEPIGDRTAVREFIKGRTLMKESGKENEAMKALNNAIDKYERHAQAYERRGQINFILTNHEDAIYDFSKSIDINPNIPESFFGRAKVYLKLGDLEKAVADFEKAIRNSIPLQPIYWKARRLKGECLVNLGDFESAVLDFKLFSKRAFKSDNPNFKYRKSVLTNYAETLMKLDKYEEAIPVFDEAMTVESRKGDLSDADQLVLRGMALQKAGKNGYLKDWKKATELGSKKAATLLQEFA